jgi:Uma2 family endonuclease
MNAPTTLPWPGTPTPSFEDVEGAEFVDGQWQPKHPATWVEREHDRRGCEFIDGEWRERTVSVQADAVIVNLLTALREHVRATKIGRVQGPECGYQCFPDDPKRVRKPDASFIAAGRLSADQLQGNARIAPDLAAEVASPNDKVFELNRKVTEYLAVGVKLVWLVFPLTRAVWVLRSDGTGGWVAGSGQVSGEGVIPGFAISLDTLFAEE